MTYIAANNLDDLMHKVFEMLLDGKKRVKATKGWNYEEFGVTLGLRYPRARLSRSESRQILASCLGELLWYLNGSDQLDFIQYYLARYDKASDDTKTIHGAYGPRLLSSNGQNQIENVIQLLRRKPTSRRAAIQLFEARDLVADYNDIPCTCTMQFMIRNGRLNMITYMRSNDAYVGLPHDIFSFTMLQEVMARSLETELGFYRHSVGSLHLYEPNVEAAQRYLSEGFQDTRPMPLMPKKDPWESIEIVKKAEASLRLKSGASIRDLKDQVEPFWADLIRILQIYSLNKSGADKRAIISLKNEMVSDVYESYARKFERRAALRPEQPELPLEKQ
ncbi:thymidylate synthase [Litorivita sp. NS0012-18]|uniref:thymidylate synthase n=1 Tax=Litorivita sp. NS0012-18 TaxID=3127655 RepID=UPI00334029E1